MARITVFSTGRCPVCEKTKSLLTKWRIPYRDVRVDENRAGLVEMARLTRGARSVPQIVMDGKWIGGIMELTELHMEGELDDLVEKAET